VEEVVGIDGSGFGSLVPLAAAEVVEPLVRGLVFGLAAGLAPGPLVALVIAQTVRHGLRDGIRVAAAPLVTDLPIVVGALLVVGSVGAGPILGAIALAGAGFVTLLAVETWRAAPVGPDAAAGEAPRSWRRGIAVNLLSPHPYLFWLTVGAPALLAAAAVGPVPAVGFLAGFYGALVGSKAAIAAVAARAGRRVGGPRYALVMRVIAAILVVFAAGLLFDGLRLVGALGRAAA
jgi:threonine/homoserine/homoserine lactone efflux protein